MTSIGIAIHNFVFQCESGRGMCTREGVDCLWRKYDWQKETWFVISLGLSLSVRRSPGFNGQQSDQMELHYRGHYITLNNHILCDTLGGWEKTKRLQDKAGQEE